MPRVVKAAAKAPVAMAFLIAGVLAAGAADAQVDSTFPSGGMGGGGGGGGGGRHGGHRGGQSQNGDKPAQPSKGPKPEPEKPVNQIEIVGVIRAIDPASGRITIAYEPVDELNWPAGTMPFVVGKTALLKDATVGEKIRFKLDNQQISALRPF